MKLPDDDPRATVWNQYYGTLKFNPNAEPYRRWSVKVSDRNFTASSYSGTVAEDSCRYRWAARWWIARNLRKVRKNALRADTDGFEKFD